MDFYHPCFFIIFQKIISSLDSTEIMNIGAILIRISASDHHVLTPVLFKFLYKSVYKLLFSVNISDIELRFNSRVGS